MSERPTVVLVGHCGPDSHLLRRTVLRALPDAAVVEADNHDQLNQVMSEASILLINRVLDKSLAGGSGIELIRQLKPRAALPVTLLISNYDDAQRAAEDAGALPGFGKAHLYAETTLTRLRDAAAQARPQPKIT